MIFNVGANYGSSKVNKNLLDNGWFTVNQRGQTSYTVNKDNIYTVDRWKFDFPGTLTVSNGITCTPSAGAYNHKIYQIIPNNVIKPLIGKRLTVSANISIRNGYVRLMKKSELATVTTSDAKNITIPYTTSVGYFSASFNLTSDYDGTEDYILLVAFYSTTTPAIIKNIKLEVGSISTLESDSAPDYITELLKCETSTADPSDTYANKNTIVCVKEITGTLAAGSTSLVLSDASISTNTTIESIYTSKYGVSPTGVTVESGKITLTFTSQTANISVKVRCA